MDEIRYRVVQWKRLRKLHFKLEKKKVSSKTGSQMELPPGHLRQIIKSHGDFLHRKFAGQKRLAIGGMKYAPHAILKLFENMPMPWEEKRKVKVLYHVAGVLTFINEVPRVVPPLYIAQWAATWRVMRREKRDRQFFNRVRFPIFDDEEVPLDYLTHIDGVEPPEAILEDLDEENDQYILDWFYDHLGLVDTPYVNGLSYKKWQFPLPVISNLYRYAKVLVGGYIDRNQLYLFDLQSLLTSKALNQVIPGGPRFEPLYKDFDPNNEWTEFNDLNKAIVRNPISTELKIAYPNLYNNRPRSISIGPYHFPCSNLLEVEDISKPYDGSQFVSINFSHIDMVEYESTELEDFVVGCDPMYNDILFDPEDTSDTLSLFFAPEPFNTRSGRTQRAQDIPLCRSWYNRRSPLDEKLKVRVSYQKLLKGYVSNKSHHKTRFNVRRKKGLINEFKSTPYFMSTTIDWVEAGLQIVMQGFNMCNLLVKRHRLNFLKLDYNFNLKAVKTLNTKERRKSRFGNGYHLLRELFKFTKLIVDCHVQYRIGQIDAFVLADALMYVFSHAGHLTGLYRYKYKLMHQIRECKDLKHMIYSKFNKGIKSGPGAGFWGPLWRVWIFFMRGIVPLLERWLGSRVSREFEGRYAKRNPSTVTKQRIEANYDVELKDAIACDIMSVMPEGVRKNKIYSVLRCFNEAWRCWKANIPWVAPGLPSQLQSIILRYVKQKADWWTSNTHYARERISKESMIDKAVIRKNTVRLARLYMKDRDQQQSTYLQRGTEYNIDQAASLLILMNNWLQSRQYTKIPKPPLQYRHDMKMLLLALQGLQQAYDVQRRMNQSTREELGLIEHAHDNPQETLQRIKRSIYLDRAFREVKLNLMDMYTKTVPVYEIDPMEKITDAYLDQYLWYEADRRKLFPQWVQPSDTEPYPRLVYKWCKAINDLNGAWDTDKEQTMVLMEIPLQQFYEQIDLTFLSHYLKLALDHTLAEYMTAKNNVTISFKDMSHKNSVGLVHGLQFTSFIAQYFGLLIDLCILGPSRAADIAGSPVIPNLFLKFASIEDEIRHPIRLYQRFATRIHILYKFTNDESRDLIRQYLSKYPDPNNENILGYPNKNMWPRDSRMRLIGHDVNLGRATFWHVQDTLPPFLAKLDWESSFVSVYSKDNPNLLFSMCGFEVRILPKSRIEKETHIPLESAWVLQDKHTHEATAYAFLRVSDKSIQAFDNRTKQILLSSQATTFMKVANKWNTHLIGLVVYFREALISTPELLDAIVRSENRVQGRVKLGLNSKMPNRFPPCVFYTPKEFGGLGLVSMGYILIPQSDIRYSTQTTLDTNYFRSGLAHEEQRFVPAIYRYVQTWEGEFADSDRVWEHYKSIRKESAERNKKITIEDLDSLWDRGIPRINTLFQKERHTLAYDKGWRSRLYWKKYSIFKLNPYSWTHQSHDGKLWNLTKYRSDVVQAFGGPEGIFKHTIFAATGYRRWDGLFWDSTTGYEEALKFRKMTNAQRMGLAQVPNRRFTLWWSPTINRSNVYVGFQTQLDLTGILMHGKIPTLKVSYLQLFRGHMWQKIHESLVMDICQHLDSHLSDLQIDSINKQTIHPRKSFKMMSSAADIVLVAANKWRVSNQCFVKDKEKYVSGVEESTRFWVDVQLRWGDYDSHDVERYTRGLYASYTTDRTSLYPSSTGIIVCVDLCYNLWTAYGNWFPGLRDQIAKVMEHSMNYDPSISVFRERVRKSLQLYTTQTQEQALTYSNLGELFGKKMTWIVDDTHVYRTKIQKTFEGNYVSLPVNGGIFILNPANGQLFLKVVHTRTWQQQKRLQQLAKWKAAEETLALMRTFTPEEQPRQIICTRELLVDPLQITLSDFPNIAIKGSDMQLPVGAYMKIGKIADLVMHASDPRMVIFNLYDDWGETIAPHSCFSRLMLIMRALIVDRDETNKILRPDVSVKYESHHIWPTHSPSDWEDVEVKLKDIIVEKYSIKNNISPNSLTSNEIRSIIFGIKIAAPSEERQKMVNEEELSLTKTGVTTLTTDQNGEQHVVQTFSIYEQKQYESSSDWRSRAISSGLLPLKFRHITIPPVQQKGNVDTIIIPENLIKTFINISDPHLQVLSILYKRLRNPINEVVAFLIPPQNSKYDSITIPYKLPNDEILTQLEPIGLIHTTVISKADLEPADIILSTNILSRNQHITNPENFHVLTLTYPASGAALSGYQLTMDGVNWGMANKDTKDRTDGHSDNFYKKDVVSISPSYTGIFFVPSFEVWNLKFFHADDILREDYNVVVGVPKPYFHMDHRVIHFNKFLDEFDPGDVADLENNLD